MKKAFELLREIKSVTISTTDGEKPYARIIDIMQVDEEGVYFSTLASKPFYKQLIANENISITAMNKDYVQIRLEGKAVQLDDELIDQFRENNPAIVELFPNRDSGWKAFRIADGKGEIFDLSGKEVKLKRERFSFGNATVKIAGCYIREDCIECGECIEECPFGAISVGSPYKIDENYCDECGICERLCPVKAIDLPKGM